jgi:2-hydroxy-6-oxonona-2,4-dienedioate hydrolase
VTDDAYPRFRWLERGRGTPVVLLHGLLGEMTHWQATLDELGEVCRPLALELPVFQRGFHDLSLPGLAGHVRRFLDALELPRAVIGGNSLGGHIALELALSHPDVVSGLILTGSSGLFERSLTRGVPHRPTPGYVREKMLEVFHDSTLVTDEWVAAVHQLVTAPHSARRVLRLARAARHDNLETRLPLLKAPTLLVWGRDDRITPLEVAGRFNRLIAGSELVVVRGCGHAPMLEQPAHFTAAVIGWLEATRGRRAADAALTGRTR